jgi:response regulator RpfG family c-di-GMP phosphodiesterase
MATMPELTTTVRNVLVVEDDDEDYEFTRDLFAELPAPRHELVWARDYGTAIDAAGRARFDVCLVDYRLGGAESGIDLARALIGERRTMPVILLTGMDDREIDERAASIGAADYLVKGEISAAILDRAIRYAIKNHAALEALQDSYRVTVRALAAALELRDDQTGAHASRVTDLALRLARRVAPELADDPELEYGFLLHDIGKIGVPDAILLKPDRLDPEELGRIQRHVTLGRQILAEIPYLKGTAADIAAAHHERWDGTGYPNQLQGAAIPLAARVFSVVDTFDAITNDRPYRRAQPLQHAISEIRKGSGTQFDPTVVQAFIELLTENRAAA